MPEPFNVEDPDLKEKMQRSLLDASIATKWHTLLKAAAGVLVLKEGGDTDPVADCYTPEERLVIGDIATGIVNQIMQLGKDTGDIDGAAHSVPGYLLACGMRMGYLAHEQGIAIEPGSDQEDPLPELFDAIPMHDGHELVYQLLQWLYTPEAIVEIGQYANSIANYASEHEEELP